MDDVVCLFTVILYCDTLHDVLRPRTFLSFLVLGCDSSPHGLIAKCHVLPHGLYLECHVLPHGLITECHGLPSWSLPGMSGAPHGLISKCNGLPPWPSHMSLHITNKTFMTTINHIIRNGLALVPSTCGYSEKTHLRQLNPTDTL